MNDLRLFLPCAAGVEDLLRAEVLRILGHAAPSLAAASGATAASEAAPGGLQISASRGGVQLIASWRDAMLLNLHCRLAQRVLVELQHQPYRHEEDIYNAAGNVAWEIWFTNKQTFKIEITAQHSPLKSLNFAALKVKDAIADRFRHKSGERPSVEVRWPDARVYAHLTHEMVTLYIDTSGEPLFKRGWREDKGDAPLKETLAAAMIEASGWGDSARAALAGGPAPAPLYDPCCGSGTIAIEAAQIACNIAPGSGRHFGFEKLLPYQAHVWNAIKNEAANAKLVRPVAIFGSDVAHRMVDFAVRNAQRAGVASCIEFRGGDALQRMPPAEGGVMLVNPPYGERIAAAGAARGERIETAGSGGQDDFFTQLAAHWKKNYAGWTGWVLSPDLKLPGRMRLKESRRMPMWNGPIECRLFKFDMVRGSART